MLNVNNDHTYLHVVTHDFVQFKLPAFASTRCRHLSTYKDSKTFKDVMNIR